jgi:hypothetical protein
MKIIISLFILVNSLQLTGESAHTLKEGDIWVLEARSNILSSYCKFLYHMPNDAYHTQNARDFNDWDIFSIVDSRDIERLNKGDSIQLIDSAYNEKVYKVKLLSGYNKNKIFYVITDDLLTYYKPKEDIKNE